MIGKTERPQSILIVAPPGDLQAGLQVLLAQAPAARTPAAGTPASEVLAVASAHAALAAVARHRPSLVILDGDIPHRASPTLLQQIKERWPALLCLVLSNCPEECQAALDNGADAALVKGFPAARLMVVVKQLLATGKVEVR